MLTLRIIQAAIYSLMLFIYPSFEKGKCPTYHNEAEITGADRSMRPCNANDPCNCPGGFFIHIDHVPDPKGKCISCTSFKTMQFPDGFILDSHPQFPIAVTIDWNYNALSCDSSRINIIHISKR